MAIHNIGKKFSDNDDREGIYIEHDTDAGKITIISSFDGGQCRDTYQWNSEDFVKRLGLNEENQDFQAKKTIFDVLMDLSRGFAEDQGRFLAFGDLEANKECQKAEELIEGIAQALQQKEIIDKSQLMELFSTITSVATKAYCDAGDEIRQLKSKQIDKEG